MFGNAKENQEKVEVTEEQPPPPPSKKKKRVTWKPEENLVKVHLIENIAMKYGDDLFIETSHSFGNARDFDILEGKVAFHRYEDPEEMDASLVWRDPPGRDFKDLKFFSI